MEYLIYNINNLSDEDFSKWFSLMAEEKQNKVSRYKDIDRKKCSVAGEMLVKEYVGKTLNISPENIEISIDKNGKPYIKECEIHFNISHCENILVCAFSNSPIGIDIEKIRPISLSIAKRFFSSKEQEYIIGHVPDNDDFKICDNPETLERFYRIYTIKEAICKKSGIGIIGLEDAEALPYLDCSFKEKEYIVSIVK